MSRCFYVMKGDHFGEVCLYETDTLGSAIQYMDLSVSNREHLVQSKADVFYPDSDVQFIAAEFVDGTKYWIEYEGKADA